MKKSNGTEYKTLIESWSVLDTKKYKMAYKRYKIAQDRYRRKGLKKLSEEKQKQALEEMKVDENGAVVTDAIKEVPQPQYIIRSLIYVFLHISYIHYLYYLNQQQQCSTALQFYSKIIRNWRRFRVSYWGDPELEVSGTALERLTFKIAKVRRQWTLLKVAFCSAAVQQQHCNFLNASNTSVLPAFYPTE
ncbi:hypothetical protein G6F42_025084 [Rhizopus arrhizus]|nr:hypothetical protein G6F42_025084 [Rhizopus arrhizus]